MEYPELYFPYDRPCDRMTPGALKKAFAVIMEQLPERIGNISAYFKAVGDMTIGPTSDDQELDLIPGLIAKTGSWHQITDAELEYSLVGVRPKAVGAMRAILPRTMLDGRTLIMCFDAAMLWGEAFRFRYPEAHWAIGKKPKIMVDYGDPVLVGVDDYGSQFGLRRDMVGQVWSALSGTPDDWTLSKIIQFRAFRLGLGPDPDPDREKSEFEKEWIARHEQRKASHK